MSEIGIPVHLTRAQVYGPAMELSAENAAPYLDALVARRMEIDRISSDKAREVILGEIVEFALESETANPAAVCSAFGISYGGEAGAKRGGVGHRPSFIKGFAA